MMEGIAKWAGVDTQPDRVAQGCVSTCAKIQALLRVLLQSSWDMIVMNASAVLLGHDCHLCRTGHECFYSPPGT